MNSVGEPARAVHAEGAAHVTCIAPACLQSPEDHSCSKPHRPTPRERAREKSAGGD